MRPSAGITDININTMRTPPECTDLVNHTRQAPPTVLPFVIRKASGFARAGNRYIRTGARQTQGDRASKSAFARGAGHDGHLTLQFIAAHPDPFLTDSPPD